MATSTVYPSFSNVNPSNWSFGEVKKLANGSGSIRIKQSATSSATPVFVLDRMRTPFGVEDPYVKEGEQLPAAALESTRRNMSLSVDDPNLGSWFAALDERMIEWVFANSTSLLGKVVKRSTVEDVIYFRSLRPSRKEGYAPTFRVKVNIHGEYQTKFFVNVPGTKDFFQGEYTDVPRNSEVVPTVEARQIWVTSTQVGITFIATHLLVFPPALESENPYQGYNEVPRPVPRAAGAAAAAPRQLKQDADQSADTFNFTDDQDPTNMF